MYLFKYIYNMPESTTQMLLRRHKLNMASYLTLTCPVSPRVFLISVDSTNSQKSYP